jgi:exodeoxyribonuclease III
VRLLTWNVLLGGEERLDAICAILSAERPDLVVLEECVGWEDGARLGAVAEAIGVPANERHAVLGAANARPSGRRYPVGLLSRAPLIATRTHTKNVAHGIVEAELEIGGEPLFVLGAHLVSNDEGARLLEVGEILTIAPPEALRTRAYVLAGDLNALARHDPYPADLNDRLDRAGIHKYGQPPRFEVMDRLLDAGFIDALREEPRPYRWVTARRERRGEVVDTRTDYVLLSPPLAKRLVAAYVVDVGQASDHHAVVVELEEGPPPR